MRKQSVCAAKKISFSFHFWFSHVWISNRTEALRHLYDKQSLFNHMSIHYWRVFWKCYLCAIEHCIIHSYDKLKSKKLKLAMSVYKTIGSYVICMNQLCYNIFNPMENFFSGRICLLTSWAWYEARSRNWIWLDKFTNYVTWIFESPTVSEK